MLDYDAAIEEVDILIGEARNSSTTVTITALKEVKQLLINEKTNAAILDSEKIKKDKTPKLRRVNPKMLRKGLMVNVIRGRNQGHTGEIIDWETPNPNKKYPQYDIEVKVNKTSSISYLGLGDIRLI